MVSSQILVLTYAYNKPTQLVNIKKLKCHLYLLGTQKFIEAKSCYVCWLSKRNNLTTLAIKKFGVTGKPIYNVYGAMFLFINKTDSFV